MAATCDWLGGRVSVPYTAAILCAQCTFFLKSPFLHTRAVSKHLQCIMEIWDFVGITFTLLMVFHSVI